MNSHYMMFPMEGMDLWDPSKAFLWPNHNSIGSSGEESNESLPLPPPPMWASEPQLPPPSTTTSHWSTIDEDTIQFGDYSELGVDELYAEGVVVESCFNSSNNSRFDEDDFVEDEDEDEFNGDHEEAQVHFFGEAQQKPAEDKKPDKEITACNAIKIDPDYGDEKKKMQIPPRDLLLKIECGFECNDSVVSTPDVVNDVITLEDEGLIRRTLAQEDNHLIKIEGASNCNEIENMPIEFADYDVNNEYDEYVVEYIDESELEDISVGAAAATSPATATVDESSSSIALDIKYEVDEDDGDEDYIPEPEQARNKKRRSTRNILYAPEKKRGRPAKPLRTHLTPRELVNLDPEAKMHKVSRFKNNEASRLSRFKRRQKDLKLGEQCDMYENENRDLRRALKKHNLLHKQLRALVVGMKFAV